MRRGRAKAAVAGAAVAAGMEAVAVAVAAPVAVVVDMAAAEAVAVAATAAVAAATAGSGIDRAGRRDAATRVFEGSASLKRSPRRLGSRRHSRVEMLINQVNVDLLRVPLPRPRALPRSDDADLGVPAAVTPWVPSSA